MASFTPDSKLVSYTNLSPNVWSQGPNLKKDILTPHHMACNMTAKALADRFAMKSRHASANYCIDSNGLISQCVPEGWAAGTSSNRANDMRAITFEIANDNPSWNTDAQGRAPWHISDKAMEAFINLSVDICKRHGIPALKYAGKAGIGKPYHVTLHKFFSSTACPGPYLENQITSGAYINEVNRRLNGSAPGFTPIYNGVDYSHVFNAEFYAAAYADLRAAYGNNEAALFNHFLAYGMSEERQAKKDFNVKTYAANNGDLYMAYGPLTSANAYKYYQHYCVYGYKENRRAI